MRDFRQFSHFVVSKSTFSKKLFKEPLHLLPQNLCFMRGLRPFSVHLTKCHACHGICTLSPLDAALHMRFAKKHPTRHVQSAASATKNDDGHVRSAAPGTKTATHLLKTSQKYCACHTKRLSTRDRTRLNVTKCHVYHAKRSNETSTSKNDPSCRTYHRHGHTLTRSHADGCGRLRKVAGREHNVERTHPPPPDPQSETGTLATRSGKMYRDKFVS